MSKLVIELQKDIIENRLDTISILRKAKLIATKLNLNDFFLFTYKSINWSNVSSQFVCTTILLS